MQTRNLATLLCLYILHGNDKRLPPAPGIGVRQIVKQCNSLSYYYYSLIGGHLRPRPHLPLNILIGLVFAPQTGEQTAALPNPMVQPLHEPIGSGGAMSCWRRCPTHRERGQSRWRVGWQWSILVLCVVCCGLWVCKRNIVM